MPRNTSVTLGEHFDAFVNEKAAIRLTDGNDTGSQVPPVRAAEIARDRGVVIHTVGVADPTTVGEEALDETVLNRVASVTGGSYFHAANHDELEQIYTRLDELAPRKVETISHRPRRDLFHWPLGAALLLTLLYHGLAAIGILASAGRVVAASPEGSAR